MKYFLTILFIIQYTIGFSQIEKYYGGCGNEIAVDFITYDSKMNILGTSNSFDWGNGDIYNIMIDTNGITQWAKTYRYNNNGFYDSDILKWNNNLTFIQSDMAGTGNSCLIAVDSSGQILWSKTYSNYRLGTMIKSHSNELIIAGLYTNINSPDALAALIKFDSAGNYLSSKSFLFAPNNSSNFETFAITKIIQNTDSTFIISGHCNPANIGGVFIMKLDKNFHLMWSKVFDFYYYTDRFVNMVKTSDNGYMIAGSNWQYSFIVKLNSLGNIQWAKKISLDTYVSDFIHTTDNNYLLLTSSSVLIKLNGSGSIIWAYQYDSSSYYYATAAKVLELNKNYYLLKTSISNPIADSLILSVSGRLDILIVKIDSMGNSDVNYLSNNSTMQPITVSTPDFTFTEQSHYVSINNVLLLEKNVSTTFSDSSDCIGVGINDNDYSIPLFKLYPNPNQGNFTIEFNEFNNIPAKIEIYNLLGILIYKSEIQGAEKKQINLLNENKGFFIIKISTNNFTKIIKINCL